MPQRPAAPVAEPPPVLAVLVATLFALAFTLGAGVLLAVVPSSDGSFILFNDQLDIGLVSESLLQACQVVGTQIFAAQGPLLFGLVPMLGAALGMRVGPRASLAWGMTAGVPFAGLMIGVALLAGSADDIADPDLLDTALMSFGWGAVGGLLGAWWSVPKPDRMEVLPPAARPFVAATRVFAIAFTISAVGMTSVVVAQTLRDAGGAQAGRPKITAAVENGLYAVEHGTHGLALGSLAQFDTPDPTRLSVPNSAISLLLPVPVTKLADFDATDGYRITTYQDVLPGWLFAAGAAALIGLIGLLCLYAGFAAARAGSATTAVQGLGWGLVVGPVWAALLTVANVLSTKTVDAPLFGIGNLGSVAAMAAIWGCAAGALGGALAAIRR